MVKGYLCLHRCGLADDQRAVVLGRTGGKYEIAAIAPALRSCFPECRVPNFSRRSHGVFVSEMPYEMEQEEEREEEDSGDDLDDVGKMTRSERRWRLRGNRNDKKSQKRLRRGFGRPSKSAANPATRKFRAEVEELKLRTTCNRCGNVAHWVRECPQKHVQCCKGGGRGGYSARKNEYFHKKTERETHFCDWSPQHELRFLCFFKSKHCSLLDRIRKRREQRRSLLEKAKKQKIERERAIGEYGATPNSSPGNGIIDTGDDGIRHFQAISCC